MQFEKPTPVDSYATASSIEQRRTEDLLNKHRPRSSDPIPALRRNEHLQYLFRHFLQGFPTRFVSQDASQPWLVYWTVHSFSLLSAGLDTQHKQRAIDTIMACQHPEGGFGGGPAQNAHLLPTYAAVSALAIVGRPGIGGGWDQIDRGKLYAFFMSLKQPDGSFLVSEDSEVDIRGVYCLLVVAYLLNLLTPELIEGTADFISSLQTYEGGFANASHPYYSSLPATSDSLYPSPRPPLGEAHGGYTFCAVASWVMLQPFFPHERKPSINIKTLTRWLALMQGSAIELGGFRGRTNKLVDACYSWWVGGTFTLLNPIGGRGKPAIGQVQSSVAEDYEGHWSDVDDSLMNRLALQEYILFAAQHSAGGLRDKPPKSADSYHTLYSLAGLSSSQHWMHQTDENVERSRQGWKRTREAGDQQEMHKRAYAEAVSWTEEEGASKYLNGPGDRVNATHPLLNLTMTHRPWVEILEQHTGQRVATGLYSKYTLLKNYPEVEGTSPFAM